MMKKIIWIDDEYEKQDALLDSAYHNYGVTLIPFKTSKAGMEALANDLSSFSGVILDAKVFYESENEVAKLKGLQNSIYRLKELSSKRYIPYVVFTGQKDLESNETFEDMIPGVAVFKKGIETDKMFNHLLQEIGKLDETTLIKDFRPAFEACEFIGGESKNTLLQILLSIRRPLENFDDNLYFTQIRIILEGMFRSANKYGLLHDKCIDKGKVNLTESSLFLAGKDLKYSNVRCTTAHFPKIIADSIQTIIHTTGAASHTTDPEIKKNMNIAEYRKLINTPYLLYSLTFQLMDILIWYVKYVEKNPDISSNQKLWIEIAYSEIEGDWIQGKVTKIAENGYGTFQPSNGGKTLSIIPNKVNEHRLKEKQPILVTTKLIVDKILIQENKTKLP